MGCIKRGLWIGLTCALVTSAFIEEPRAGRLSLQAGIGYEFISQRYFADSVRSHDVDSTLAAWSLTSTYLDDISGRFTARWQPLAVPQTLELGASFEQTPDYLRLKTIGNLRYRKDRSTLDVDTELEWRDRTNGSASFGDSYLYAFSRAKAAVPLLGSTKVVGRFNTEIADFRSGSTSSFDYVRTGGTLGLEKTFTNFSWADLSLLLSRRDVPDSSTLNYDTWGLTASFFGFLPTGNLDLSTRLESRDYHRPDGADDHWRLEVVGRNRFQVNERWFGLQEIDLEHTRYSASDWINADYLRIGATIQLGMEASGVSMAVGPDGELLTRTGSPDVDSLAFDAEDYWETGGKLDLDYLGEKGLVISMESNTGYRTLRYENELQASFWYERVFLLTDIQILSLLNLSTMFSAEWEWYRAQGNNSALYLLSTSLTYSF